MSAVSLLNELSRVAGDDNGVSKTCRFILDLAVGGALVPADRDGDSGRALFDSITAQGSAAFGAKWRDRLQKLHPVSSPPFTLASHWAWVPFGSLIDLVRGVTYTKSDVAEGPAKGYLPILRANNIRDGLNFHELVYVRENRVAPEQMPREGDYVLALSSGSKNLVGKAAFVTQDFAGGIGGFCGILRVASPGIGPFVGIYLASQLYREAIALGSRGIGINNLQRGALDNLPFPLPPLGEQQRIVAKVNELMALCDELEVAQAHRETRRDRLRATSLRNLVAPEEPKENARFFLRHSARMITSPEHVAGVRQAILDLAVRGRLVRREGDWIPSNLGAVGRWGSGGTPATGTREFYGGSIPWIVIGDLNEGVVTKTAQTITEPGLANSSAKLIDPGTVLIAMYGASVGKLGIAGTRCSTNQAIASCVPDPSKIDRNFLFLLLRSIRAPLVASAKGGAQPNISQTVIKGWKVDLPPIAEQRRIVAKMDELMAVCDELEESLATEQTERGRLLDALLRDALEDALPARELELLGAR